jgi:hypothetical protein
MAPIPFALTSELAEIGTRRKSILLVSFREDDASSPKPTIAFLNYSFSSSIAFVNEGVVRAYRKDLADARLPGRDRRAIRRLAKASFLGCPSKYRESPG